MKYLVSACLIVAAIIHLLPVSGALGAERLAALYGLSFDEANIAILMRHRAVMFGILGGCLFLAAFLPSLQLPALVVGLLSTGSFLAIALTEGGYNNEVARVVHADLIASGSLLVGAAALLLLRRKRRSRPAG